MEPELEGKIVDMLERESPDFKYLDDEDRTAHIKQRHYEIYQSGAVVERRVQLIISLTKKIEALTSDIIHKYIENEDSFVDALIEHVLTADDMLQLCCQLESVRDRISELENNLKNNFNNGIERRNKFYMKNSIRSLFIEAMDKSCSGDEMEDIYNIIKEEIESLCSQEKTSIAKAPISLKADSFFPDTIRNKYNESHSSASDKTQDDGFNEKNRFKSLDL